MLVSVGREGEQKQGQRPMRVVEEEGFGEKAPEESIYVNSALCVRRLVTDRSK